jgi:hypothetical protein
LLNKSDEIETVKASPGQKGALKKWKINSEERHVLGAFTQ